MTAIKNVEHYFHTLDNIRSNTIIVDNDALPDIAIVENGILIVYAGWSGPAISNFVRTIKYLDIKNYRGKIVIIDIDNNKPDSQVLTLGDVCHGWAEIFDIHKGKIIKKFLGANCFQDFETHSNSSASLLGRNL